MSLTFDEYCNPRETLLFSPSYFKSLTFLQASDLKYPPILAAGSLVSYTLKTEEPHTAASTLVLPGEDVPTAQDLLPITSTMEAAYAEGMRSVFIELKNSGGTVVHKIYHFSKIRLLVLINNNQRPVQFAQGIATRLMDLHLPLPIIQHIWVTPITTVVAGFKTGYFPLWKLGYLLGEEWLEEDVLNALLELLYFRRANAKLPLKPRFLPLPTSFYHDALHLFRQGSARYSRELVVLRQRLVATGGLTLAFIVHSEAHYTAYVYDGSDTMLYGDSMGGSADPEVVQVLTWVLRGLDGCAPPTSVAYAELALQTPSEGQGSCGVAAFNFIEQLASCATAAWDSNRSTEFRDLYLRDLVLYHYYAATADTTYSEWTELYIASPEPWVTETSSVDWLIGFENYTLDIPTQFHPVATFNIHRVALPSLFGDVPFQPLPPRQMLVQQGLRSHILPLDRLSTAPIVTPLGAAITRSGPMLDEAPTVPASSTLDQELASPSGLVGDAPIGTPISPALDNINNDDTSIIDITDSTPSPVPMKHHLSSSDPAVDDQIIDLTGVKSSPITPLKRSLSVRSPSPFLSAPASPDIIIISSSDDEHLPKPPSRPRKSRRIVNPGNPVAASLTPGPDSNPPLSIPSTRDVRGVPDVRVGSNFTTLRAACAAICQREARWGFKWRRGQSKSDLDGLRKLTMRCSSYSTPQPQHSVRVDPVFHRQGRTSRTNCMAHVNINCVPGGSFVITLIDWTHNHPRHIPEGGIVPQPPSTEQRDLVSQYADTPHFGRQHISTILSNNFPDHVLEKRQVSNMLNSARMEIRDETRLLGGDINAVMKDLKDLCDRGEAWQYETDIDHEMTLRGLWWQSADQAALSRRYHDILITDGCYNRNQYGFPLCVGIIIDQFGHSRNIWYAVIATESVAMHSWILRCHLKYSGIAPEVFATDRHISYAQACQQIFPTTFHLICLHHLLTNLRTHLKDQYSAFSTDFWLAYYAVSPEHFNTRWDALVTKFPRASTYLQEELYSIRERWAWAWVSHIFTAGVRTNGRVESENRINKSLAGPKKSLRQVFRALNDRTADQTKDSFTAMRHSFRRTHNSNLEMIFRDPLALLRAHAGPYALNIAYEQMREALFYQTHVVQRPDGVRDWDEFALEVEDSGILNNSSSPSNQTATSLDDDSVHISTQWLLRLIRNRGFKVVHLLKMVHMSTNVVHYLAVLPDDQYVCDCCMGINRGIPCRHYFRALIDIKSLQFHLGLVRSRWLGDQAATIASSTERVSAGNVHAVSLHADEPAIAPSRVAPPKVLRQPELSNPLAPTNTHLGLGQHTTPAPTSTINSRVVHAEVNSALRPLLNIVQTEEELVDLLVDVDELTRRRQSEATRDEAGILDPPVVNLRGRPRTARLTGATEGRPRGGGPRMRQTVSQNVTAVAGQGGGRESSGRRCGVCRNVGHNRNHCPRLQ